MNGKKSVAFKDAIKIINSRLDIKDLIVNVFEKKLYDENHIAKFNPNWLKNKNKYLDDLKKKNDSPKWVNIVGMCHETENDDERIQVQENEYRCFRCGHRWDVIQTYLFLVKSVPPKLFGTKGTYGKEFVQTVKDLSKWLGYELEEERKLLTRDEREKIKRFTILKKASELYHKAFLKNEKAQKYFFETRGFQYAFETYEEAMDFAKKYKIGFAPQKFPSHYLLDKLKKEYTTQELLDVGLLFDFDDKFKKTSRILDFYSESLIIPYLNNNRVYNIYARRLNSDKNMRHLRLTGVVNEPIFFEEACRHESVILLEGEITALTLKALNYNNVIATKGTNGLKEIYIERLVDIRERSKGKWCNTIFVGYDGDEAGKKAAERDGERLMKAGFDVFVIQFPEDKDANDILVKYKKEARNKIDVLIKKAPHYYTFKAIREIEKNRNENKYKLYQKVKSVLKKSELDDTELVLVANEVSEQLGVSPDVILNNWLNKNINEQELYKKPLLFITDIIRNFYRAEIVFPDEAVYLERLEKHIEAGKNPTKKIIVLDSKMNPGLKKEIKHVFDNGRNLIVEINWFSDLYKYDRKTVIMKIANEIKIK